MVHEFLIPVNIYYVVKTCMYNLRWRLATIIIMLGCNIFFLNARYASLDSRHYKCIFLAMDTIKCIKSSL